MSLRNQPYIPLYVNDFMVDEKLAMCSAESTGVYIRLMCLMHKSEPYGVILLKQNEKQNIKQIIKQNSKQTYEQNIKPVEYFAYRLSKQMPYSVDIILRSLEELSEWDVVQIDGDALVQKRMKKDGEISDKRSFAGKSGGKSSRQKDEEDKFCISKTSSKMPSKTQANSEYEIESLNEDEINKENGMQGEKHSTAKPAEEHKTKKPKASVFIPPTLEEVKEYARSRSSTVDPFKFWDYYEAGGWADSKGKPVKNWKQKLITWEDHDTGKSEKPKVKSFSEIAAEMEARMSK